MHVVVIFHTIGGYHAARLRAAYTICQQKGWRFTVVEVTDNTIEHPWGDIRQEITFPYKTLMPVKTTPASTDRGYQSTVAASLLPTCLDTLKPSVLIIPGWGFPVSRAAVSWCQRHRIPAILMSESKRDDEKRQWWKEQLKSWLYVRRYKAALVGGELHRRYLIELGMPRDKIFLGYDVVDNDYFRYGADMARRDPDAARRRQPKIPLRPYFLSVTRLLKRKNVLRLVEAFATYRQQIGEEEAWDLVVCGIGEEETSVRNLIYKKKLNNCVHLPGFITYKFIVDWYGLANAFVHPAVQEQWGLVVNEACAAGLPILCSHTVGACPELVQESRNGLLFDPDSSPDITRALLNIHRLNSDSRTRMAKLSRQIIANYSPQIFSDGLLKSINAVLKQN